MNSQDRNLELLDQVHLDKICSIFDIYVRDIQKLYVNPGRSANNENFVVMIEDKSYLYRVPGTGSDLFCDRKKEYEAYQLLRPYEITDELIYFERDTGVKVSAYYEDSHIPDAENGQELEQSMQILKYLHELDLDFPYHETLLDRMELYFEFAREAGGEPLFLAEYFCIRDHLRNTANEIITRHLESVTLTHGDASINNVLITHEHDHPILIDLEFFAKSDSFSDIATFSVDADFREEKITQILDYYLRRPSTIEEQYHAFKLCCIAAMMWYGWAAYKTAVEENEKQADFYLSFRNDYQSYILDMMASINRCRQELGLSILRV